MWCVVWELGDGERFARPTPTSNTSILGHTAARRTRGRTFDAFFRQDQVASLIVLVGSLGSSMFCTSGRLVLPSADFCMLARAHVAPISILYEQVRRCWEMEHTEGVFHTFLPGLHPSASASRDVATFAGIRQLRTDARTVRKTCACVVCDASARGHRSAHPIPSPTSGAVPVGPVRLALPEGEGSESVSSARGGQSQPQPGTRVSFSAAQQDANRLGRAPTATDFVLVHPDQLGAEFCTCDSLFGIMLSRAAAARGGLLPASGSMRCGGAATTTRPTQTQHTHNTGCTNIAPSSGSCTRVHSCTSSSHHSSIFRMSNLKHFDPSTLHEVEERAIHEGHADGSMAASIMGDRPASPVRGINAGSFAGPPMGGDFNR